MEKIDFKKCQIHNIKAENEMTFNVTDSNVSLKLLSGFAEISGSELVENKIYTLRAPASIALFTWQGCTLELYGDIRIISVQEQSWMIIPTYMHACLEEKRIIAETEHKNGPTSLVVGKDACKSYFCKILLNYAARLGRQPLFIDLNVYQNVASLPGTLSILPVEEPSDVFDGFNHRAVSVYSFGYTNPAKNVPLYFLLVKELGNLLKTRKVHANPNARSSGVIINAYGWNRNTSYSTYKFTASAFDVDVVFVIEDEKLFWKGKRNMPKTIEVVYVPKQDGVTVQNDSLINRQKCIRDYFYGSNMSLKNFEFDVNFSEIEIYKISPSSNEKFYPKDVSFSHVTIVRVPFAKDLQYHILGLSRSDTADENLIKTNVIGFLYVTNVCLERNVLRVLSPQPSPLPSKILLMGNIQLEK